MVTAVVESSPLRQRQRQQQRVRSPLAGSGSAEEEFEVVRHLRPATKRSSGGSGGGGGMRGRRWAPPEIEIPDTNGNCLDTAGGGGRGYTSLRDIMSSSPTAKGMAMVSPDESPGPGGRGAAGGAVVVAGDVHMIRHPLVKHAAYAYLQLTPSAMDAEARRRMLLQRRRGGGGRLCRVFFGCLGFLGALFGR